MALDVAPDAPLSAVEWRVDGKPQGAKARFVPYLNAPTVARLLDQWVGPANWKDDYEPAAGKGLWGIVSVRVGDEWVAKKDIGVPSNFEGEKGQVSDAFKRSACLKWGVGRNVYDLPTLWAPCRVDQKGNAWPTDDTLPHITKQLKAMGFEASGGTVAAYHDEPVDAGAVTALPATDDGRGETIETARAPLAGFASLDEEKEAHDHLAAEIKNESAEIRAQMKEYQALCGYGWPMEESALMDMSRFLDELRETETAPPVEEGGESAAPLSSPSLLEQAGVLRDRASMDAVTKFAAGERCSVDDVARGLIDESLSLVYDETGKPSVVKPKAEELTGPKKARAALGAS